MKKTEIKKAHQLFEELGSWQKVADIMGVNVSTLRNNRTQYKNELQQECDIAGIDMNNIRHYWYKSERFSINATNPQDTLNWEDIKKEMIKDMKKHAPKYPKIKREKNKLEPHLLIIDPADCHLGKLAVACETGDEYNIDIAYKRCIDGVKGLLERASHFNIEQILLIIGNDILHIDSPHRKTTAGTPQDTDRTWHEAFKVGRKLYVEIIETLIQTSDVHVIYNPSNHDFMSGFMLADAVECWFNKSKNVTFDTDIIHRKYYQYGKSLIATTHGDGAKQKDLPLLLAQEAPQMWANTRHRYFYTHHIHHYSKNLTEHGKDYIGVTVESLRSPSAPDSYHYKNGYISPKAIEGFIHSKANGQVAKFTHYF